MLRRLGCLRGLVFAVFGAGACASAGENDTGDAEAETDGGTETGESEASSGDPYGGPISLAMANDWTPMPALDDPFRAHRPADVDCPEGAWAVEDGTFEVQTGACAYAAFEQSAAEPVAEGMQIRVVIAHEALWAAEGEATAHVAVGFGAKLGAEATVAIPSGSGVHELVFDIESRPADEDRLWFHLHNHGFNTWRIVSVTGFE